MKKVLSLILAVILCVSLLPLGALAGEEPAADLLEDEVSVDGTNSVGSLIANTLEESETAEESGMSGSIVDIAVEGTTATVEFSTSVDADLVAAVYTEDGVQMLGSGVTRVSEESDTAEVEIVIDEMPAYFTVGAFLLDAESHEPLCEEYISRYYTQEFQEFLGMTTEDFDEELVLNLDEDETTNFLVFSEDTLLAEETAGVNEITDNGDGTYTIRNADESFRSLQPGGSFSYTYEDGSVLIVVAKSVSVEGTTVTVVEDLDASLEAVFDYVRIDGTSDGAELDIDMSSADDGVSLADDSDAPQLDGAWDFEGSSSHSITMKLAKEFGGNSVSASIEGYVTYSFETTLNVYISLSWQYIKFEQKHSLSSELDVSGELKGSIPLGEYGIAPVPGVLISLKPAIVVEFEAKIHFEGKVSTVSGFVLDSDVSLWPTALDGAPTFSGEINVEGTVFIGLSLDGAYRSYQARSFASPLRPSAARRSARL